MEIPIDKLPNEPYSDSDSGTIKEQDIGVEHLSLLERQRTLITDILEEVVYYVNSDKTYKQVSSNKSSGGIDQMDTNKHNQTPAYISVLHTFMIMVWHGFPTSNPVEIARTSHFTG